MNTPLTLPMSYTDPLGNCGVYRRVGNNIEFNATYPPAGIDIETSTLTTNGNWYVAKVIGWTTNTIISEPEGVVKTLRDAVNELEIRLANIEDILGE